MAYFPCDVGLHHNPKRNTNVYVGVADEVGTQRSSARVCEWHWSEIEPRLSEFEVAAEDAATGNFSQPTTCGACLKPLDERGIQLFVTAYPAKDHRKDYWLQVHRDCRLPAWLPWRGTQKE